VTRSMRDVRSETWDAMLGVRRKFAAPAPRQRHQIALPLSAEERERLRRLIEMADRHDGTQEIAQEICLCAGQDLPGIRVFVRAIEEQSREIARLADALLRSGDGPWDDAHNATKEAV
jgi:hypothetical protein